MRFLNGRCVEFMGSCSWAHDVGAMNGFTGRAHSSRARQKCYCFGHWAWTKLEAARATGSMRVGKPKTLFGAGT